MRYRFSESPYLQNQSFSPKFTDGFASAVHPAALASLSGWAMGFYIERKYLVRGLDLATLNLGIGKERGGAGIMFRYFGNAAYNEMLTSIRYSRNLGSIGIAVSMDYQRISLAGFGSAHQGSMGFYSLCRLTEKLYTALELVDLPFSRWPQQGFNARYAMFLSYESSAIACLSIGFIKKEDAIPEISVVAQYRPDKKITIKAGLTSIGPQPFFGICWLPRDMQIQVALCYHPALGSTPGFAVAYQKKNEEPAQ